MRAFRWIAVPLAGIAAWYVTLFAGIIAAGSLDSFCPPDLMTSGMCGARWHRPAFDTLIILFAGIAAFLIVIAAALTAPSHKLEVAWTAFGTGCLFAIYAVIGTATFVAFLAAVLSGLLAVWCIARRFEVSMLPWRLPQAGGRA